MRLPNAAEAIISAQKLRDYLLSPRHRTGRFKATFFGSLGYTENDWARLEADLRSQHLPLEAEEQQQSPYGRKFVITGQLKGPFGEATLVSVWVIRTGEAMPRFVTAYPRRRR